MFLELFYVPFWAIGVIVLGSLIPVIKKIRKLIKYFLKGVSDFLLFINPIWLVVCRCVVEIFNLWYFRFNSLFGYCRGWLIMCRERLPDYIFHLYVGFVVVVFVLVFLWGEWVSGRWGE